MLKQIKSDIYYLLHPKMAFFLTSISKKDKPNVMTCAWATPASEEPPIVVIVSKGQSIKVSKQKNIKSIRGSEYQS
ncbi:MAG: hypothetical protein HY754_03250 [Nitrospirae bacterium]|nr:hypothetical protein [Nitrospirota bacterium]